MLKHSYYYVTDAVRVQQHKAKDPTSGYANSTILFPFCHARTTFYRLAFCLWRVVIIKNKNIDVRSASFRFLLTQF